MLKSQQMFLFLFKSKYRRKCANVWTVLCVFIIVSTVVSGLTNVKEKCVDASSCSNNGVCKNETCICNEGWQGAFCQHCGGKVRLAADYGTIHDGVGNYSVAVKCSWLIDAPNSSITLHLEEFATECGWDNLYIFDGDSVNSPLLAVYSGLMYRENYKIRRVPEVIAHSGAALLHFFSDDAYNMSGFNMTYRINGCPSMKSNTNCSGNGICIDSICTCNAGWVGNACHLPICPNDCFSAEGHGSCSLEHHRCECRGMWSGAGCGQISAQGYWMAVSPQSFTPPGSASAGAIVWRDTLYIVSGQSFGPNLPFLPFLYTYDFNGNVWETPQLEGIGPGQRYGHSSVLYGDKVYVYGGVWGNRGATKELWTFDVSAKVWENITVKAIPCNSTHSLCGPLRSSGHTATIFTSGNKKMDRMIVIFGHSPQFGYLNTVQEFYFGTREWNIVDTKGFPVKGGYGHSSAYDAFSQRIYVYGGIVSESESTQVLNSKLYSYEPHTKIWTMLTHAPSSRYLHTSSFVTKGLMMVFGGYTHNDTAQSYGAKCYSNEFLAYDVLCDSWQLLSTPTEIQADLARFGHTAVTFEGSMYIYGGFDGQMLSDILRYTPGNCSYFKSQFECLSNRPGVKCVWERRGAKCISISEVPQGRLSKEREEYLRCPEENRTSIAHAIFLNTERCSLLGDCHSCVQTTWGCKWCGSYCSKERCRNTTGVLAPVTNLTLCPPDPHPTCKTLHTCTACSANSPCHWDYESHCSAPRNASEPQESVTCPTVCADLTSCLNCTQEECIWCQNEGRCVDKNAYIISFPYGQCREWTTLSNRCRSGNPGGAVSPCAYYTSCAQCRDDPACGWCDDGSHTGLGSCMAGGYQGPNLHDQSLPSSTCPTERWHFTTCPKCQCNGHSTCDLAGHCVQPCRNDSMGHHCEKCRDGYWGNPVNGGRCQPCQCNGKATKCNHETGKCYCTTKGLTGDHCEKCDAPNDYTGDPSVNRGSCYYELKIDYQFTFNLSKKEDRHYTQINFRNSPNKQDIDVDFSITCSVLAKLNITMKTANNPEKVILPAHNCTTYKTKFQKSDYNFRFEDNITQTTFYVYVYDFQPPLWIQISFSQYPKLNLQQFFITFSFCFLALLLVAAIIWKIKQKYDMYRRRQRLYVEMEQMASRPFSQVLVEIDHDTKVEPSIQTVRKRNKRGSPSPIALEPCVGNRAAVLSLLVRLPTGGELYTPLGQSAGLAVASALVTLGNPRRNSVDLPKTTDAGKGKVGRKGQSQHPDGCI